MTRITLKSIEEEAADCRKAFEGVGVGLYALHVHHEVPIEMLKMPAEDRITYILEQKPESERALRLRLFRPLTGDRGKDYEVKRILLDMDYEDKCFLLHADYEDKRILLDMDYKDKVSPLREDHEAKLATLYADYEAKVSALHREYCTADCPWDGETIFPAEVKP